MRPVEPACTIDRATVMLESTSDSSEGNLGVSASVKLEKVDDSGALVTGEIRGLTPGIYDFRLLQFDDDRSECSPLGADG